MPRHVSFDAHAERLYLGLGEAPLPPPEPLLQKRRRELRERPERASKLFGWLSDVDHEICRLYFFEELTQEGVSKLLGIGQPEVSGRLHSCVELLFFLDERPTLDPIQAWNELSELLPLRLVEHAYVLYLNVSPSRVADRGYARESTVRNLRKEVLAYLEKLASLPGPGPYDYAALAGLGLIDPAGTTLADDEVAKRRELASRYLEDFRRAKEVSARLVRPFRKNEADRANALIQGEPITGPPVRKTGSGKQTEQMRAKSNREPSRTHKGRAG